jgi:divalent metal cation (Fe/Co/Zn/Cd) transporter
LKSVNAFHIATLSFASRQIKRQAKQAEMSFMEYFKKRADPSTVQVFMEDSAALLGVMIASGTLVASRWLDLWWLDSAGSITIGLLLSSVGVFLVKRNLAGLIQTRMDPEGEREIVELLQNDIIVQY